MSIFNFEGVLLSAITLDFQSALIAWPRQQSIVLGKRLFCDDLGRLIIFLSCPFKWRLQLAEQSTFMRHASYTIATIVAVGQLLPDASILTSCQSNL